MEPLTVSPFVADGAMLVGCARAFSDFDIESNEAKLIGPRDWLVAAGFNTQAIVLCSNDGRRVIVRVNRYCGQSQNIKYQ